MRKLLVLLFLFCSCTTLKLSHSRDEIYKLNAEYLKKVYNVKVNNKDVSFYKLKTKTYVINYINDYKVIVEIDENSKARIYYYEKI